MAKPMLKMSVEREVAESDFGAGGEIILDTAYFYGALVVEGDLHCASLEELRALIASSVRGDEHLNAGHSANEGAQLALLVRGSLRIDAFLHVGGFTSADPNDAKAVSQFCFCLGVDGHLRAPGLSIGNYSHVNISGDIDVPFVRIGGSDGAMLHCGGTARVGYFVHDQEQWPIRFETAPVECKTYEIKDTEGRNLPALVEAIARGESPLKGE
ncbi:MAG: hypothetical protein AB8H86_05665 [Polyangiales bacterium]